MDRRCAEEVCRGAHRLASSVVSRGFSPDGAGSEGSGALGSANGGGLRHHPPPGICTSSGLHQLACGTAPGGGGGAGRSVSAAVGADATGVETVTAAVRAASTWGRAAGAVFTGGGADTFATACQGRAARRAAARP